MRIEAMRGWAAAIFLGFCLVLGGASGRGAGALANGLLQVIAIILILFSLWTRRGPFPAPARQLGWIVGAFLLLIALSLIPLPADVWSGLPGREPVANGYSLLGIDVPSLSLSLSPQHTIISMLWLLPPIAIFLLVLQSSPNQRRRLVWTVLTMAVLSIALGAAQLLGGEASPLRFYRITNVTQPVGFFANANHQATLLLCALPLAGYLAARALGRRRQVERSSGLIVAVAIAVFLLVGIGIIGSLAGYGLALPAGLATFLIYRKASRGRLGSFDYGGLAAVCALFVAFAFAGPLSSDALSEKLSGQPSSRGTIAEHTVDGIEAFFPVGSGLGSYQDAYRRFDDPGRISREFTNHAHNDYLEVAFELGVLGCLIVLAFIFWWIVRSATAWRSDFEGAGVARAGSVIIFIVLLHSIVDYPIRTSAIAALFALACGLMIPYLPPRSGRDESEPAQPLRHLEAD